MEFAFKPNLIKPIFLDTHNFTHYYAGNSGIKIAMYTYSQARAKLADILEESKNKEIVILRRKGDMVFIAQKSPSCRSPFDVPGKKITRKEMLGQFANLEKGHYKSLVRTGYCLPLSLSVRQIENLKHICGYE